MNGNYEFYLLGSLVGSVLWALLPGFIAKKKGRSFLGYFLLSLVISPLITTIIVLCLSDLNKTFTYQGPDWKCACGREHSASIKKCVCGASKPEKVISAAPPKTGGWTCSCGRSHADYVSSCTCGLNKRDVVL